jgi:hypothetical protein
MRRRPRRPQRSHSFRFRRALADYHIVASALLRFVRRYKPLTIILAGRCGSGVEIYPFQQSDYLNRCRPIRHLVDAQPHSAIPEVARFKLRACSPPPVLLPSRFSY